MISKIILTPPSQMNIRLRTIILPSEIKIQFRDLFLNWVKCSGPRWAIDRVKHVKDCLIKSVVEGIQPPSEWIAKTPNGNWCGTLGIMARIARRGDKEFERVLQLVNLYTCYTVNPLSLREHLVFQETVNPLLMALPKSPAKHVEPSPPYYHKLIRKAVRLVPKMPKRLQLSAPTLLAADLPGKHSHVSRAFQEVDEFLNDGRSSYIVSKYRLLLEKVIGEEPMLTACGDRDLLKGYEHHLKEPGFDQADVWEAPYIGHIGTTLQPGGKARHYAAPNIWCQVALKPLQKRLLHMCEMLPWDCTFDQRKADETILQCFSMGNIVHSVDLSKATDMFPMDLQMSMLKAWIAPSSHESVNLFYDLSRCNWVMNQVVVQWTKGQPLGLGPSFPAFALTHGMLLYALNGCRWDKDFFVLGDDVVICNNNHLKALYIQAMDKLGVPISPLKTFSSDCFAQFGGREFLPSGGFWNPKWIPVTHDNALDAVLWWGPSGIDLLRGFDREVTRFVLALPEPFGLGYNPNGIPLDLRFPSSLAGDLLNDLEDVGGETDLGTWPSQQDRISVSDYELFQQYWLPLKSQIRQIRQNLAKEQLPAVLLPLLYALDRSPILKGFPPKFKDKKKDPYSYGTLQYWKQMYKKHILKDGLNI